MLQVRQNGNGEGKGKLEQSFGGLAIISQVVDDDGEPRARNLLRVSGRDNWSDDIDGVSSSAGVEIIVAKKSRRSGTLHVGQLMHGCDAIQFVHYGRQRGFVSLPAFHVRKRNKN